MKIFSTAKQTTVEVSNGRSGKQKFLFHPPHFVTSPIKGIFTNDLLNDFFNATPYEGVATITTSTVSTFS